MDVIQNEQQWLSRKALHKFRLILIILIKQKDNCTRTTCESIASVLDVIIPNVRDLSSLNIDEVGYSIYILNLLLRKAGGTKSSRPSSFD